jgi:hypothetical protein
MFGHYSDITERIAETPMSWDENGVPRCLEFAPRSTANIYAVEVVLLDIACSMSLRRFQVAISGQGGAHRDENGVSVAGQIRSGDIDYCDPPNYGNCPDGAATGCFNLAVLQFWCRDFLRDGERNASLEIVLPEMKDYDEWPRAIQNDPVADPGKSLIPRTLRLSVNDPLPQLGVMDRCGIRPCYDQDCFGDVL